MISTRVARSIALAAALTASILTSAVPSSAEPTREEKDLVLRWANKVRVEYGARPLTWSDVLTPGTEQHAQSCKFGHSDSHGRYGENLYFRSGADHKTAVQYAFKAWMDEGVKYRYSNPAFSSATANFTQLVWKRTTQISLAVAQCPAGTIADRDVSYVVARFSPPGNQEGQFAQNVGRRI